MSKKIIGVFKTTDQAIRAINSLNMHGYDASEISFVTRNMEDSVTIEEWTNARTQMDQDVEKGVTTGAAAGGVLGGVTGLLLAIGAVTIPALGPFLAAGPIVSTLGGAVIGAGAGGLTGALIGFGIPEEHVEEYEQYLNQGYILVMVERDANRETKAYEAFRSNDAINTHLDEMYLRKPM